MGKEIERKFLLAEGASIPIPRVHEKHLIKQGYLHAEKGKQVRIRIYNDFKAYIGVKFTESQIRDEFEYLIPLEDGLVMYDKTHDKLEKKRLSFRRGKEHYDVDTFPNGLTFVEVEFKSLKAMENWEKPSWMGEEITGVGKYSNINLAKKNLMF
jgi:CYTH domain-containing protein